MKALAPAVGVPFAWSTTRVGDYVQLFRLRVAGMVLFTVFLGGWLAAVGPLPVNLLAHALVGTALVTAAASALAWLTRLATWAVLSGPGGNVTLW